MGWTMTDPILEPQDYTGHTIEINETRIKVDEEINDEYSIIAYEQAISESLYNQQVAYEQQKNQAIEPI